MPGNFVGAHQGCQVPFRPPIPNVGLLRRCSGKGLHLAMTREPRGFSGVAAGFSSCGVILELRRGIQDCLCPHYIYEPKMLSVCR